MGRSSSPRPSSATFSFPGAAAYAASKSGLIGLTQALAAEFGPEGIRVNAILPGAIDTPMYRDMNDTEESQTFVTSLHALKRVGTPEEIANSVLYLASDDAAFVTGTASLVDGGLPSRAPDPGRGHVDRGRVVSGVRSRTRSIPRGRHR